MPIRRSTRNEIEEIAMKLRNRLGAIALWGLQVVLAGLFFFAGASKVAGVPPMVALFDAIGAGHWFRYLTGLIEVVCAVTLLLPALAPFGALLLVPTMVGAIAVHLVIVGGSPAVPAFLLLGSFLIAWVRRAQLFAALARLPRCEGRRVVPTFQ